MSEIKQITVGLIADEGFPTLAANYVAQHLHDDLTAEVSDSVDWEVHVCSTRLDLDERGQLPIADLANNVRSQHGWDLVLALTDLPHRVDRQPIVSRFNSEWGVAVASVPALGAIRIRRRTRALLVHLIRHLAHDRLSLDDTEDTGRRLRHKWEELIAPVAHMQSDSVDGELQLALVGVRGRLRLLAGMVRDNRPWRLVPHLSTATAAAAATAAYGLVNTSFWNLADSLPAWRLAIVNAAAVVSMAVWILVYKHLWDRPEDPVDREGAALNNVSTLVTLTFGVVFMYAILYSLTLLAAAAIVDSGYLHSTLGHPAGIADYATITWLASSVGIVAGAIGSSLETEDAVEKATYSYRERQRRRSSEDAAPEAESPNSQ
ncbi:MAG: hypothetical protein JWN96_299 [Mycobacterium sp.]|jgi:hypothetical protein|nr:hypothetical protein [Mycobacterium sp.]